MPVSQPGGQPASANKFERRSSFESADTYLYALRQKERGQVETPERRLIMTVLCDALRVLQDYHPYRHEPGGVGPLWRETWEWFWSDEEAAWLMSAAGICAHLNVEIDHLRLALVRWSEREKSASTSLNRA